MLPRRFEPCSAHHVDFRLSFGVILLEITRQTAEGAVGSGMAAMEDLEFFGSE